jgi:hypothetical protein
VKPPLFKTINIREVTSYQILNYRPGNFPALPLLMKVRRTNRSEPGLGVGVMWGSVLNFRLSKRKVFSKRANASRL